MDRVGRGNTYVIKGADGRTLRVVNLPSADIKRWVPQRKAEVVSAVHTGVLSLEEACRRYALSLEEFLSWETAFDAHGVSGLRMAEVQHHRNH